MFKNNCTGKYIRKIVKLLNLKKNKHLKKKQLTLQKINMLTNKHLTHFILQHEAWEMSEQRRVDNEKQAFLSMPNKEPLTVKIINENI